MSNELNKKLIRAVEIGYLDGVQRLIVDGADPNTKNEDGDTVLMMASLYGNISIANVLLLAGAHINLQTGKFRNTALHSAAHGAHEKMVQFLLQNDADPYSENWNKNTPLDIAKQTGNSKIVRLLKEAMAE